MKITFLGTRGFIKSRTRRHYRHASTLIVYKNYRIMIDCGLDWSKKVWDIKPDAIIVTHAHPDHGFGLKNGSPCPVYATEESWRIISSFNIEPENRKKVYDREKFKLGEIIIEPFELVHSILAPAVGYRITAGKNTIFCAHDIVYIKERKAALANIKLYIGDGASPVRDLIRRKDNILFGHASIKTQLSWCKNETVPAAIFTHCGSQIVEKNSREINKTIEELGKAQGVIARIAYDGLSIEL